MFAPDTFAGETECLKDMNGEGGYPFPCYSHIDEKDVYPYHSGLLTAESEE
jgi:hypothetical protein